MMLVHAEVARNTNSAMEKTPNEKVASSNKGLVAEFIETAVTSVFVLFIIYATIAMPEQVSGSSMEPTYMSGERILVDKLSKHFEGYARGEVVVLNPPSDDYIDYIKRIVGVPGDIVKILDCNIYISRDGEKFVLDENYMYNNTCTRSGPKYAEGRSIKLDENEYFLLGDNRNVSADSRFFGVVTGDRITGRVIFRFWPFNKAGFTNNF